MKKTILAIILLALVIGLAFVREYRESLQDDEVYAEGLASGRLGVDSLIEKTDSLESALETSQRTVTDTVASLSARHRSQVDSMQAEIARRDSIAKAEEPASNQMKAQPPKTKLTNLGISKQLETDIVAHYKQQYRQLPADLTQYERRVALAEIREETAREFKISEGLLSKIREKYSLSY
jgi:demethoxyubiquinone hydroxylase (CLK1/Coq7/Cat5 family)